MKLYYIVDAHLGGDPVMRSIAVVVCGSFGVFCSTKVETAEVTHFVIDEDAAKDIVIPNGFRVERIDCSYMICNLRRVTCSKSRTNKGESNEKAQNLNSRTERRDYGHDGMSGSRCG